MIRKEPAVYMMANRYRGTIYIGVTNNIVRRTIEHKQRTNSSFTSSYQLRRLVLVERFGSMFEAIQREKQLKNWKRQWKIELIEKQNPNWNDLFAEFGFEEM